MLGADLVFSLPFVGTSPASAGHTLACNRDAERLLPRRQLVGVWPEGFKGIGKPYTERYKLQRFGRGGFVSAALRTGVPIIPTSIVGAEEIYPILGKCKLLARLLGLPYFPITPTFPWLGPLGLVPLPSKWLIEFGEPIPTDVFAEGAADDPMLMFNLTDQVRETIQHTLYKLLMQRRTSSSNVRGVGFETIAAFVQRQQSARFQRGVSRADGATASRPRPPPQWTPTFAALRPVR